MDGKTNINSSRVHTLCREYSVQSRPKKWLQYLIWNFDHFRELTCSGISTKVKAGFQNKSFEKNIVGKGLFDNMFPCINKKRSKDKKKLPNHLGKTFFL